MPGWAAAKYDARLGRGEVNDLRAAHAYVHGVGSRPVEATDNAGGKLRARQPHIIAHRHGAGWLHEGGISPTDIECKVRVQLIRYPAAYIVCLE